MKKWLKVLALCLSLAIFAALPLSACSQGSGGTDGPDDTNDPVQYTVTFSAGNVGDDEVTGMPAAVTVESGQKVARPAAEPSREGYEFDDWYTAAAGGEAFDFNTAITQNTTIYAQWTESDPDTPIVTYYTVTFDGNADNVSGVPSTATVKSGEKIAKPSSDPSRDGYTFRGWFRADQGGRVFDFDAAITGNTTVYAQWWKTLVPTEQDPVRVACVGDSLTAGGYPEELQAVLGDRYDVENFGRSGSTVTGYPSDNKAYTTFNAYQDSLDFDPDVVLMMLGTNDAQDWANAQNVFEEMLIELIDSYQDQNPEVTVIFMTAPPVLDKNDFGIDKDDLTDYIVPLQREIAAEMGVKLLDVRDAFLAEDNYEDLYKKDNGTVDNVHFGTAGNQFLANLAAEAVRDLSGDCSVVFSAGDVGSENIENMPATVTLESGQKVTKPATDPVREGYTFEGWFTQASGGEEFDFDTPITQNTTIYAQWSVDLPAEKTEADLVLFIGQSNMAGRGAAETATQVESGHAYEFRAISDPTQLYPVKEPFGVNENNSASGVSESKKTGSLVSAFCESCYAQTNTPIVAVSCSKGGEPISFFAADGAAYNDAVARVNLAKEYLTENEDTTNLTLGNVYVVWLQGESDGDRNITAEDYTAALDGIVQGFKEDIGADQFFIIPIGAYNGSDADGTRNAAYTVIRNAQIEYCADSEDATVISTLLEDLKAEGLMKDEFHFFQSGYEIVGTDAGANMAYFVKNGTKPVCKDASECSIPLKEGGAWLEKDGQVVISAEAALEQSAYASYHNGSVQGEVWGAWDGWLTGMHNLIDEGKQWNGDQAKDEATGAPYLQYKIKIQNAGTYYVYLLITSPDGSGNTVHIDVDGTLVVCGSPTSSGTGRWQYSEKWKFDLTPGEHTVTIYVREDGVTVNQVALRQSYETWDANAWRGIMLEESDREEIGEVTPETEYDVTFNANAGSDEVKDMPSAAVVESGKTVAKPENDPVREGYGFIGWFTEPSGGTPFDFNSPITKDTVIYAQWEKEEPAPGKMYGAWQETDGQLVINTIGAAEQSEYATWSNGYYSDPQWSEYDQNGLTGMKNADNGIQWDLDPEEVKYPYVKGDNPAPYLQFKFNIANAGTYHVFIMMTAPSGGSNTCFIDIDGQILDCGAPTSAETGKWQYDTASEKTWVFDLTAGEHTLTLYVREDGICPNQIVLRKEFNSSDLQKGVMLKESEREVVDAPVPPEVTEYDVTFDANAGSDEVKDMPSAAVVESGKTVAKPENDPVREGYGFIGWFTEPSGGTPFDFDSPITKDTVIYAQWEAEEEPEQTYGAWLEKDGQVVINTVAAMEQSPYANYNDGPVNPDEWERFEQDGITGMKNIINTGRKWEDVAEGGKDGPYIKDPEQGSPYLQYKFNITSEGNWYVYVMMTASSKEDMNHILDIDGTVIDGGGPSSAQFARWQHSSNWAFNLTAGEHTLTMYLREDGICPNQIVLRRLDEHDGGAGLENGIMLLESDREWLGEGEAPVIQFTVTFDANADGGDVTDLPAETKIEKGSKITAPETAPVREGYTFLGWFTEPSGGTQFDFESTIPTRDITLYARWEVKLEENQTFGAWQEKDGLLVINTVAAAEQSEYAFSDNGPTGLEEWEPYDNGSGITGMQSLLDDGRQWRVDPEQTEQYPEIRDPEKGSPYLQYKFKITNEGEYYLCVMMTATSKVNNNCIVMIDDNIIYDCSAPGTYDVGKWQYGDWKFDGTLTAGEHTLTVFMREDGICPNQIVLHQNMDEGTLENGVMLEESEREILTVSDANA